MRQKERTLQEPTAHHVYVATSLRRLTEVRITSMRMYSPTVSLPTAVNLAQV